MIEMYENDKIYIAPDTNINKLLDQGWSEEEIEKEILRMKIILKPNIQREDFESDFIEKLKQDSKYLA